MRDVFGFKNQSKLYNLYRPSYPDVLVKRVANSVKFGDGGETSQGTTKENSVVVDVACGTGLFSRKLAPYFGKVLGIDRSLSQTEVANQSDNDVQNVKYMQHDACDLHGALCKSGDSVEKTVLVTVAQGFHWLPFDKFLTQFRRTFKYSTIFAPVGYPRPMVMNETLKKDASLMKTICNSHILNDSYDPKFALYEEYFSEFYTTILPYFEFDRNILENFYADLPFDKYFSDITFLKFSELNKWTLFTFQQYVFSISAYNVFVEKNVQKLEQGLCKDPLVKLLKRILEIEGKVDLIDSKNLTSENDAEVLKSVDFHALCRYFVYLLRN